MPPDIHPLPDDISAYFVYPYSLEAHVLAPEHPHISHSSRIDNLSSTRSKREQFLKDRETEKVARRRAELRRVAPGYEPPEDSVSPVDPGALTSDDTAKRRSGILEPTRKADTTRDPKQSAVQEEMPEEQAKARDPMDELVEGLAKMDKESEQNAEARS